MSEQAARELAEDIQRQIERHREENWENLEPEKRGFAISFLSTPSPRAAAESCGISPNAGARFYRDPVVRAYLADLQEITASHSMVTASYVESLLLHYIPVLAGEEKATTVVPGVGLIETERFYPAELLRAIDMLAKSRGFYNSDLSNNPLMQMMSLMTEAGKNRMKESVEQIDPKTLRLVEKPDPEAG